MLAFIPPLVFFLGFTCLVLVQKFSLSSLSSFIRTYELDMSWINGVSAWSSYHCFVFPIE